MRNIARKKARKKRSMKALNQKKRQSERKTRKEERMTCIGSKLSTIMVKLPHADLVSCRTRATEKLET